MIINVFSQPQLMNWRSSCNPFFSTKIYHQNCSIIWSLSQVQWIFQLCYTLVNTNTVAVIRGPTNLQEILWLKSWQNPEDFHFISLAARDQWKWWRHFKLQAKMLSELIIRRDSVYTSWLTYLHLHCTNLSVQQIPQLDLSVNLILYLDSSLQFFDFNWLTDWLTDWLST